LIQNILCYLEESEKAYPDKPAFSDEHTRLTYKELLSLSRRIGSFLGRKTGPRRPIPVMTEKNAYTLGAFMGIVHAGCFYIYLDAGQPSERLNRILNTLQADIMIADSPSLKAAGAISFAGEILDMGMLLSLGSDAEDPLLLASIRGQAMDTDPLYGIFTSGSTGTPKGVVVGHRSVIDFMEHFTEMFHITSGDVIGNQAPFDFDVSVKDIYSTLKTGASMEIIPKRLFSIPTGLLDYLCDKKITTAIWAVSALCIITTLNGFTYRVPEHLDKVLFSGEVMPVKHLNTWRSYLPDAMFVNLYGPTEITCNCTYHVVDRDFEPGSHIPIGLPFPNEKVFLLDGDDRLITGPGICGELCVSGTALALGYYRDREKTAAAFVQNPLNQDYPETIYRTGDMAYYGEDGLLYYHARRDFQIKHMGHRIELGEIEAALETVSGVGRAVCIFLEEKNKIAAFYEGEADKKMIAAGLEHLLPRYMFPNRYVNLPALPLTKNGKVDRQALRRLYG